MRDVSEKIKTLRVATALATLKADPATIRMIREDKVSKGDPLPVAKVAAIQAAKNASQIIPYCHPLPVDYVGVEFRLTENTIEVEVTIKVIYKTGVEMEALTAASVGALTLYDMLKMHDESMEITGVRLLSKTGGKTDFQQGITSQLRVGVIVISDSVAAGQKEDLSGQAILDKMSPYELKALEYRVVSDEPDEIEAAVKFFSDTEKFDLILTTGGTGLSLRDNTPEVLARLIEKDLPGVAEAMRDYGQDRTPYAMLSRGVCGVRGQTMIVTLPGSRNGVRESLDAIFPALFHGFKVLRGASHASEQKVLKS